MCVRVACVVSVHMCVYMCTATCNTMALSMTVRRTTRPKPPVYDDPRYRERIERWRKEHPEQNELLQRWEKKGCDIQALVACASCWVIQSFTGYPPIRQDTKRIKREFQKLPNVGQIEV